MRRYLRRPGAICCPAPRALRAVLKPCIRLCDDLHAIVEPTTPKMRRLSPPAGCSGCSVGGKPGSCLLDGGSTHIGARTSLRTC
jgi:hypothetical protein